MDLWSIYLALILINSRAHVGLLCQHIRGVYVSFFSSQWLHTHVCEECYMKLPLCRFFSLTLCQAAKWVEN